MASTSWGPWRARALCCVAAGVLAACGGGGGSPAGGSAPAAVAASGRIDRLVVAGDSLADAGTFGFKATVQRAADPAGYPVFPELVARDLGLGASCNFFSSSDGQAFATDPACTNFAVGGALIQNPVTRGGDDVPFSIEHQLEAALAASGGQWRAGDLLLVDGGGNDAAALADAYLDARAGGAAERAVFLALLAQQLDASDLAGAADDDEAAGLYMQSLARDFWATVKATTLDRGATRLALVDVPDISLLPRLRDRAAGVEASEGAAAAAAFQAGLRQWVGLYNAELRRLAAGDRRVVVVPYSEAFAAQAADPAAFGLANATDRACPAAVALQQCTDALLDASPPAGLAPGWWRTWSYSDGFHPTPRGHELLAATVLRALATAGWR